MRVFGINDKGEFKEFLKTRFDLDHEEAVLEEWLEANPDGFLDDDKVLIIDTTFRSGRVFSDVLVKLKEALRRNLSHDLVRVASLYYNPDDRSTWTVRPLVKRPHYYLKEVAHEIIYPQSVHKLLKPRQELARYSPRLHDVLYGTNNTL